MKYLVLIVSLLLAGCFTPKYTNSFTAGAPFATKRISEIKKGETTKEEIKNIFGSPFSASILSEEQGSWKYYYLEGVASAQYKGLTLNSETSGTQYSLDVLFKNDVVVNFEYTEGPRTGSVTNATSN
jgi:outer membrane protein assembly factor BamE (lipoprotein component of BamABCDE complex)